MIQTRLQKLYGKQQPTTSRQCADIADDGDDEKTGMEDDSDEESRLNGTDVGGDDVGINCLWKIRWFCCFQMNIRLELIW